MLVVLYSEKDWLAINKPNGLLVHRSSLAADATEFAVQLLRDQLGQRVYPVHRLDRKTSGVLLFGLNSKVTSKLQQNLQHTSCVKEYVAIVRGFFPNECTVEKELINESGKKQDAVTLFSCIQQIEIPIPFGKHNTSRYSLIKAIPKTGRMHQIRKHLNHLRHPIIGDRPHGCNKQNRLFKKTWGHTDMLLHCRSVRIQHPYNDKPIHIEADFPANFKKITDALGLSIDSVSD